MEELFTQCDLNTIEFLENLVKTGNLDGESLSKGFFSAIKQISQKVGEKPKLLLSSDGKFIYPGNYKDFDESSIRRQRSGLIAATIKGLSSLLLEIQNHSLQFCKLAALLRFPITFSTHKKPTSTGPSCV